MTAHTRAVAARCSRTGCGTTGFQFGDWLDPDAPADDPGQSKAPADVVATACAYRTATPMAQAAEVLGEQADAAEFARAARSHRRRIPHALRRRTGASAATAPRRTPSRSSSGCSTATIGSAAGDRLAELVRASGHRISTGFAGTPFVCDALTIDRSPRRRVRTPPAARGSVMALRGHDGRDHDLGALGLDAPGRVDQPRRHDELQPLRLRCGRDWMHRTIGGLAPLEPGYRRILVAPRPGGGITWARGEPRDAAWSRRRALGPRWFRPARRGHRAGRHGGRAAPPRARRRDRRPRHPRARRSRERSA